MGKLLSTGLVLVLLFCAYITEKALASGPNISLGNQPAQSIYLDCSNSSPATMFTNTTSSIFLITDVWATTSVPGGNGGVNIFIDGAVAFSLSGTHDRSIGLTTQTGIPVAPNQSIECQRITSYGVKTTIIGKYIHTP